MDRVLGRPVEIELSGSGGLRDEVAWTYGAQAIGGEWREARTERVRRVN